MLNSQGLYTSVERTRQVISAPRLVDGGDGARKKVYLAGLLVRSRRALGSSAPFPKQRRDPAITVCGNMRRKQVVAHTRLTLLKLRYSFGDQLRNLRNHQPRAAERHCGLNTFRGLTPDQPALLSAWIPPTLYFLGERAFLRSVRELPGGHCRNRSQKPH